MSIAYTLRRRDSRSFTSTGSGVTFTVATGTRGPNIVSDATALGSLTDAVADALSLLATNAAGTAARKVAITNVVRAILAAADAAGVRTAVGLTDPSPTPAGSYTLASITVDSTGRVTAASSGSASGGTWGSITGTLGDQADLAAALAAKQPLDADLTSWAAVARASGYDTFVATPSSANLAALLTDETGSGAAVFGTGPTIAAPVLAGTVVVRQTGGVAGTHQVELAHNGTNGVVDSKFGNIRLLSAGSEQLRAGSNVAVFSGRLDAGYFCFSAGGGGIHRAGSSVIGLIDDLVGVGSGRATLSSTPLTPSQITADQNNYAPGVARYYRLSTDASRTVTGLSVSQVNGQECEAWNVGSNPLVLAHQSASSTAANRFICTGSADITLAADEVALLRYDSTTSRWRVRKV